jgi:hypothetical protein
VWLVTSSTKNQDTSHRPLSTKRKEGFAADISTLAGVQIPQSPTFLSKNKIVGKLSESLAMLEI